VKYEFIRSPIQRASATTLKAASDPGLAQRPARELHALHVPRQRVRNRGRARALGLPQEAASPSLKIEKDTLVGTLDYGPVRVATGTMGYKHRTLNASHIETALGTPNFLIKVIPHVDGTVRICEIVEYRLEDVEVRGAWAGPGSLQLNPHALAPVAELPVLEVVSAVHFVADLTLGLGKAMHERAYLRLAQHHAPEAAWYR
jgi:acetoacetate decarboxylase